MVIDRSKYSICLTAKESEQVNGGMLNVHWNGQGKFSDIQYAFIDDMGHICYNCGNSPTLTPFYTEQRPGHDNYLVMQFIENDLMGKGDYAIIP